MGWVGFRNGQLVAQYAYRHQAERALARQEVESISHDAIGGVALDTLEADALNRHEGVRRVQGHGVNE